MVGKPLQRQARRRYDGFPELNSCWEQSKHRKKHFLDHLNCTERQNYRRQDRACKPFDTPVAKIAGDQYKFNFFNYYAAVGTKPPLATYVNGLAKNPASFKKLATSISLAKIPKDELAEVPEENVDWPAHFALESSRASIFQEDREDTQRALESCTTRRTLFRNACIKDCNRLIDTRSRDIFLLILQVLRARNVEFR